MPLCCSLSLLSWHKYKIVRFGEVFIIATQSPHVRKNLGTSPFLSYSSLSEIPTLSYTWGLKKVPLSGGASLWLAILGSTPLPVGGGGNGQNRLTSKKAKWRKQRKRGQARHRLISDVRGRSWSLRFFLLSFCLQEAGIEGTLLDVREVGGLNPPPPPYTHTHTHTCYFLTSSH